MPKERLKTMWSKKQGGRILGLVVTAFFLFTFVFVGYFFAAGRNAESSLNQYILSKFSGLIPVVNKVLRVTDLGYLPLMLKPSDLPEYELWIEEDDMRDLQSNLETLIEKNVLKDEDKLFVDTTMRTDGQEYEGKVRFRGDSFMHWKNTKKSWRIKLKKENTVDGMREFNLIIPEDRGYLAEEYSNYLGREMGLDVPMSGFVTLKINGKSQGVYFMIEHFGKELLEKQELVGEGNLYGEVDDEQFTREDTNLFTNLNLWKKYTNNPLEGVESFAELALLLEVLAEDDDETFKAEISRIMDMDNVLTWQAHSVMLSSTHQEFAHNVRLYFDRTRGKFKVIPWDVGQSVSDLGIDIHYSPLVSRILSIPEFRQKRDEILWARVSQDENLQADLAYWDNWYKRIRSPFYRDRQKYPFNLSFDLWMKTRRDWIIERYAFVANQLDEAKASVTAEISEGISSLNVKSFGFAGVNLDQIRIESSFPKQEDSQIYWDQNDNNEWDPADPQVGTLAWDEKTQLYRAQISDVLVVTQRIDPDQFMQSHFLKSKTEELFIVSSWLSPQNVDDLKVDLTNSVTGKNIKNENNNLILTNGDTFDLFDRSFDDADELQRRYPFLIHEGSNTFRFPTRTVDIFADMIIPEAFTIKINPGTVVQMGPGVSFLSYGKVLMQGTEQKPIKIKAATEQNPFGVWALLDHGADDSLIKYVHFERGGEAYLNGVYFSGMLAVHFADVTIDRSRFTYATGDDGLNIKNAKANLTNSQFEYNSFDGVDLDFLTGGVARGNLVKDNGNDGMDIGGGSVLIRDNIVDGSGDKCISIGEQGSPVVFNNLLEGCAFGIAVKDLSQPLIINNTITNNGVGITSYQKKPIFGGGQGIVINTNVWDNDQSIELDAASTIQISNSNIQGGHEGDNNQSVDPTQDAEFLKSGGDRDAVQSAVGIDLPASIPVGYAPEHF